MSLKEQYYNNLITVITKMESFCSDNGSDTSLSTFRNRFTTEEKESLKLLIQQARLGLNKEKIDELDAYIDYDKILEQEWKQYSDKQKNSQTLPWMHVIKGNYNKYHFKTCMKDIRNAMLHANYVPKYNFNGQVYAVSIEYQKHNNQYYKTILQEPQFSRLMEELYGNSGGMTFDHTYFSIDDKNQIVTPEELEEFLKSLEIITTEIHGKPTVSESVYKNECYNLFQNLCSLRYITDGQEFTNSIESLTEKEPNFKWHSMQITPNHREWIKQYIVKHYPDFYCYTNYQKYAIITSIVELLVSPHQAISGTFEYFEALLCEEGSINLNTTYEQYMISLKLLKMYALLYRFQNYMCAKNEIQNYRMDQFYVGQTQNTSLSNFQKLQKIRNALAHGNIMIYIASVGDDIGIHFRDHYAIDEIQHTDIYVLYQNLETFLKEVTEENMKCHKQKRRIHNNN